MEKASKLPDHKLLVDLFLLLSNKRKIEILFLFCLIILSGVSEMASLGALVPFLTLLSDSNALIDYPILNFFIDNFGIKNSNQIFILSAILFLIVIVFAISIRLLNLWMSGQISARIGCDLSSEVFKRTLNQPYQVHLKRNSSEVINTTITQIDLTINVVRSTLMAINALIIATGIFIGMLFIDWRVVIVSSFFIGILFFLIASKVNGRLLRNSRIVSNESALQLKTLQEGLGAIREVLLSNNHKTFIRIYRNHDRKKRTTQYQSHFLASFPRYSIEAIGIIIIIFMALFLSLFSERDNTINALLGSFVLGAQRILPTIQLIYLGWADLKANFQPMKNVLQLLNQPLEFENEILTYKKLNKFKSIEFSNVSFSYEKDNKFMLKDISIKINKGERIGIIGTTGSGKSTFLDLVMGLLPPTEGKIFINNKDIFNKKNKTENFNWKSQIAHVPQRVFLTDNSITENIAFGQKIEDIDFSKVLKAARKAHLSNFISSLPKSFNTRVGERGVGLSGGQAQRIAIARALYRNSSILIFDEATSALDNYTEAEIMKSIYELGEDLTIIMIAHRIETLKRCDRIIKLKNGQIIADGLYKDIIK